MLTWNSKNHLFDYSLFVQHSKPKYLRCSFFTTLATKLENLRTQTRPSEVSIIAAVRSASLISEDWTAAKDEAILLSGGKSKRIMLNKHFEATSLS